jgi:hypothetical protein
MFAQRNQAHSCALSTVADHLADAAPEQRELYDELESFVRQLGPYNVAAVKSQVVFRSRVAFMSVKVRAGGLTLALLAPRKIDDDRFTKVAAISGSKYEHSATLAGAEDLDDELRSYIKEAYAHASR